MEKPEALPASSGEGLYPELENEANFGYVCRAADTTPEAVLEALAAADDEKVVGLLRQLLEEFAANDPNGPDAKSMSAQTIASRITKRQQIQTQLTAVLQSVVGA
jgi:hypothetical protein